MRAGFAPSLWKKWAARGDAWQNPAVGCRWRGASALVALLVAGCTGGSGSSAPSSATSESSASSSFLPASTTVPVSTSPAVPTTGPNVRPGEKPPLLPGVGKRDSAAGAITFAQFWVETLDWGYATTSSTLSRAWFAPSCTDCALLMRNFDEPRAAGDHFVGGRLSLRSAQLAPTGGQFNASRAVDVSFTAAKARLVNASGETVSSSPATREVTFRLWLARSGSRWLVVQKGVVR
ncbi:DUF6318 family protein [uncultured Jatrophihabitans sp.]|uniref:DUF6318 family protein n=1 Tax=uncultured Jatrophihabitans sp. TaxID=1610747 RepID=UPI0035CB706B